jgi:hypothetical protein
MKDLRKSADAAVKRVVETAEQGQDGIAGMAEEAKVRADRFAGRISGRSRRRRRARLAVAVVGFAVTIAAGIAVSQLLGGRRRRWRYW